jgi:energy-coupling factor transport system substrate-specific component|tara:strand:+ start:12829 stop:13488 length:660 start_codon:yes stop_codon:yes gene_type:complete
MVNAHGIPLGILETFFLNVTLLFIMGGLMLEISKNKNYGLNFTLLALILFSVVGRLLLNPIPNIQPVTTVMLLTGIFMGHKRALFAGFAVAFLSNLVLGNGIWTLYQGLGWGMVGMVGALLSHHLLIEDKLQMNKLIIVGASMGVVFNWIVSLSILHYVEYIDFPLFILSGLGYDLLHAGGNIFFIAWMATPIQNFIQNEYPLRIQNTEPNKLLRSERT